MTVRRTYVIPDWAEHYLNTASEEESRTKTEVLIEALRLRRYLKRSKLYVEENGKLVRVKFIA